MNQKENGRHIGATLFVPMVALVVVLSMMVTPATASYLGGDSDSDDVTATGAGDAIPTWGPHPWPPQFPPEELDVPSGPDGYPDAPDLPWPHQFPPESPDLPWL